MSDKTYKYVEVTLRTPHHEHTETLWPEELDDEFDGLLDFAEQATDMYERFLSASMGQVTIQFDDKAVVLGSEAADRSEVEVRLQEDHDGLPF